MEKSTWDACVSESAHKEWVRVSGDFVKLNKVSFPRQSFSDETPATLVAFCDAMALQFMTSKTDNLNFSFLRLLSPLHTHTLPTLELLAVYTIVS